MDKAYILSANSAFSIQAQPRSVHTRYGVPIGGPVDKKAAHGINILLDNSKQTPVLEWALMGPKLQFSAPTYIVVSTFSKHTLLNNKPVRPNEKTFVPSDSILKLGAHPDKVYSYLAIQGGFKVKKILGSKSSLATYTDQGATSHFSYQGIRDHTFARNRPSFAFPSAATNRLVRNIPAHPGPEYAQLNKIQKQALDQYFTLSSKRNRMGMQIQEPLANALPSILSAPIQPGTIQLTPSGKLILLGKDCQTTGGYPRILWLPSKALTTLYQLQSGIKFKFDISEYS